MVTYKVDYYNNGNRTETYKKPIDAVRKIVATHGYMTSGHGTTRIYRTYVKKIQPGTPFELVGQMWHDANGTVYFKSFPEGKTYKVSKKTGGLLDFSKYWRYV